MQPLATTPTRLMTFEEFAQLPEPKGFRYELHHGELIEVLFPKIRHVRVHHQLQVLLAEAASPGGIVITEMPYRPVPEYEGWRADVAYMPRERWDGIQDYLVGAPELVIEVLSPSNTASEMRDKRKLCLANGSVEFWVVDPDQREVEVSTADGHSVIYGAGQQIPLFFAPASHLAVDAIFESAE
jgi:Uma2 family endonuclease